MWIHFFGQYFTSTFSTFVFMCSRSDEIVLVLMPHLYLYDVPIIDVCRHVIVPIPGEYI